MKGAYTVKKIWMTILAIVLMCGMYAHAESNIAITNCVQNIEKQTIDIALSVPETAYRVSVLLSKKPMTEFSKMSDAQESILSFLQYDTVEKLMNISVGYLLEDLEKTSTVYVYANSGGAYIASTTVSIKNKNDFIVERFKNATAWNYYPDFIKEYQEAFSMFQLTKEQEEALSGFSDIETASVYKKMYLKKAEFTLVSDIEKAYSDAVDFVIEEKENESSGSSGGMGGGGGGGGIYVNVSDDKSPSNDQAEETITTIPEKEKNEDMLFADIQEEPWAKDAIEYLYQNGIINGVDETHFAPSRVLKREEFITMLIRATGMKATAEKVSFQDVQPDAYYAESVAIAVKQGIVKGVDDKNFGTGVDLSRQDLAVMLYRAFFNGEEPQSDVIPADIETVAEYAKTAVKVLMEKGIVNGVGDGRFAPSDTANRAQAAQLIYNLKMKGII